jgi:hypothetical protein
VPGHLRQPTGPHRAFCQPPENCRSLPLSGWSKNGPSWIGSESLGENGQPTRVERAARQSQAVEPEHRLVARTLERAWEEKLVAKPQLEEESHRFLQQQPRRLLTKPNERRVAAWRRIFPCCGLLQPPPMPIAKRSFERRVERVVVDVQGNSERVRVRIEWSGGGHTEGVVIRPEGPLSELRTSPQICHQVQALTEAGWAATAIAQALSDAGFRPSRSSTGFRAQTITQWQRQLGVRAPRPRVRQHDGLLPAEWWPTELVRTLLIPRGSLSHWIRQGVVRARQLEEPLHRWVVWADEAEQERLRAYHQRAIGDDFRHRWTDAPLAEQR